MSVAQPVRKYPMLTAAMVVLTAYCAIAEASTVVPMAMSDLADHAGQAIVGQVANVRSYWAQNPTRIETEVTFEQVAYLKGELETSTAVFTLVVPGGDVGQRRMLVGSAPQFKVGEKWLLLLLPTYKTYPVVGLAQGAFRIETDAGGIERVNDASGRPVLGLSSTGFVQTAAKPETAAPYLLDAGNASLRTDPVSSAEETITYSEFQSVLQPILDASVNHSLTEPAGQRVLVDYVPAPIILATPAQPLAATQETGMTTPARQPTLPRIASPAHNQRPHTTGGTSK